MIDCVIVNWNAGRQLGEALGSIKDFGLPYIKQITVVDNSSSDKSIGWAHENPGLSGLNVKYILNKENLGFGQACNQGAAVSNSPFILLLNPDARLLPDTLPSCVRFFSSPESSIFGICGVQLIDDFHQVSRSCARFPKPINFISHALGLTHISPKLGHFMAEWNHDRTREVAHVIGAFFLVRRSLFEELGGFDERFFVYLEDLDFSLRAHKAGWKTVYLADTQAFHAGGGTSNQVKARRLFYSLRSRLLYTKKHFTFAEALLVFVATLLLEPLSRSAYSFLRGSRASLYETWSGYAMLYRWLPQWMLRGVTR